MLYRGGIVRLEADITFTDMDSPYPAKTMYFEIGKEYADMFDDESYNAFTLISLFLAMYHKQDLHICGKISSQLYQNIKWYIQRIFSDYSDDFTPVNFTVDGVTSSPNERGKIIGAGISCGVDSLSTLYDHFVCEDDPEYRINALFYFNHDLHNTQKNTDGKKHFQSLLKRNRMIAEEPDIALPFYTLSSNLVRFHRRLMKLRGRYISLTYTILHSCILSLGNAVSRYYVAGTSDYESMKFFRDFSHDKDLAEFCDPYLVPLIKTENTELIIDGCQYRRVDKLKRIADWDIAKKYLNVCLHNKPDGSNCGKCKKCLRTLFPLEVMGKLDDFADVFDLAEYRKLAHKYKLGSLEKYGKEPFVTENVDFAKENNFQMPTLELDKK